MIDVIKVNTDKDIQVKLHVQFGYVHVFFVVLLQLMCTSILRIPDNKDNFLPAKFR